MLLRRGLPVVLALLGSLSLAAPALAGGAAGQVGNDVSNADCARLPASASFGIVAVTGDPAHGGGQPFNGNPCLKAESDWAAGKSGTPALYVNTADPGPASAHWSSSPIACQSATSDTDVSCAYDYGWNAAGDALDKVKVITAFDPLAVTWWLDVEEGNSWQGVGPGGATPEHLANTADLQGYVDRLRLAGVPSVGVYSPSVQWSDITGGYTADTAATYRAAWKPSPYGFLVQYPLELSPQWLPGAANANDAATACQSSSDFLGGTPLLAQYTDGDLLGDLQCAAESTDVTAPAAHMTNPISAVALSTLNAGWSSDGSGVSSYDVRFRRSPFNGPFGAVGSLVSVSALHSAGVAAVGGSTYCFSSRGRDARGNLGAWSAERCTSAPLDDRSLSASTGWTRATAAGHYRGTYTQSTRLGAALSVTVQAARLSLVATTCSHCGVVGVYLNGSLLRQVNLASTATHVNDVIALGTFSLRTTKVTLKVLSSGKTVQIDGLATSRS